MAGEARADQPHELFRPTIDSLHTSFETTVYSDGFIAAADQFAASLQEYSSEQLDQLHSSLGEKYIPLTDGQGHWFELQHYIKEERTRRAQPETNI